MIEKVPGYDAQTNSIPTALEMFYHWEQTKPNDVYLRQPIGNKWIDYTWQDCGDQIRRTASYIRSLNLPEKSKIALVSKNYAHWIMADLAIIMSGNTTVPFYPNLTSNQLNQVLTHSDSKVILTGKLDDWENMRAGVPAEVQGIAMPMSTDGTYMTWEKIQEEYPRLEENYIPNKSDLSSILYTSGTTGSPKGVMLEHNSYIKGLVAISKLIDVFSTPHRYFSFLPLNHVAEKNVVEHGSLYNGGTIHFAESLETFAKNLQETSPTMFFAVPRIWTKFQLGVLSKMPQKKLDLLFKIPILNNNIKRKIRKGLGLNDAKIVLTAAAPCPESVHNWYQKLGIDLQELYGMTENNGACTVMTLENKVIGTVGQPYPSSDLKIDAESKEIMMKAEWVMRGYYKEPDMTAEVMKDGYLHTGDMGEIGEDGMLRITGRVKDTFKTAKGEYIVPGPIEWGFALNNSVEQVCLLGRNLGQPVALIVLSEIGRNVQTEELSKSLSATVKSINKDLVDYERIKKIIIAKEDWTIDNGILTPTLKVKRNVLEARYEDRLEGWYNESEDVIWEA